MEFSDLIAVCQGFIAGAARLVPKLRGHEFTDTQTKVLENHLEKIRATADWVETAAATGQVDLDEQLAQLLRGQSSWGGGSARPRPRPGGTQGSA